MQLVHQGEYPGKSSVIFFPMINMNPGDLSCIYSTLLYISNHAAKYNVTPVVTFDQPLWWKAKAILLEKGYNDELGKIVLRLGSFHTEMSFLGSVGHLMKGTGLEEVLELIYPDNTVGQILNGKAVSRAVRAHSLVKTALYALIISDTYDIELPSEPKVTETLTCEENRMEPIQGMSEEESEGQQNNTTNSEKSNSDADLEEIKLLLENLMKGEISTDNVASSDIINIFSESLQNKIKDLSEPRTAKLWLQYLEMIDILHSFIKAERTGDWLLHLKSCKEMLPYLAASGHNLYTKSLRLYLQDMCKLEEEHPDVFLAFKNGLQVV